MSSSGELSGSKADVFQIRIDSVEDESTAPITESNSHENLIGSAACERERVVEQTVFQFPSKLDFSWR